MATGRSILVVALLLALAGTASAMPSDPLQCLRVVTASWTSTKGALQRFERASATAAWRPVGRAIPVVIGEKGLGWGLGIQPDMQGPGKREGDGRSPAGVFALTATFGFSPDDARWQPGGLPFIPIDDALVCVDDPRSEHYTHIVRETDVSHRDWKSAERMRIREYRVGVVVAHNGDARPGCGSCIFLHVWGGPSSDTSGCTAMSLAEMRGLVGWLRAEAHPVLAQMPRAVYQRVRRSWGLP